MGVFRYIAEHETLRYIIVAVWLSLIIMSVYYRKVREKYAGIVPFSYYKTEYYNQTGYHLMDVVVDSGKAGEYLAYRQLKRAAPEDSEFLFNIYIPHGSGTTEIDIVLITRKGIFVVESKNYAGIITGRQESNMWKEYFKKTNETFNFYNPIKQNATHVAALEELLGDIGIPIYSLVIFSDNARLSDKTRKPCENLVITREEVLRTLRKILKNVPEIIPKEEISALRTQLGAYEKASKDVRKAHIKQVSREYGR